MLLLHYTMLLYYCKDTSFDKLLMYAALIPKVKTALCPLEVDRVQPDAIRILCLRRGNTCDARVSHGEVVGIGIDVAGP